MSEAVKNRGRPAKKFDEDVAEKVSDMAACGTPQDDIALMVGLSPKTLRKIYGKELKTGVTHANFNVGRTLYEKCVVEKDTACLLFWAKCRMGWNERAAQTGAQILEKFQAKEISLTDAAIQFELAGLPLPKTIEIMLAKEQPLQEDLTMGVYAVISPEEMAEKAKQRQAAVAGQSEFVEARKIEVENLKAEMGGGSYGMQKLDEEDRKANC